MMTRRKRHAAELDAAHNQLVAERMVLRSRCNDLEARLEHLNRTIDTQSATHGDALRVALEQGERDRQTIAALTAKREALNRAATTIQASRDTWRDDARQHVTMLTAMTVVGDRMAARSGDGFAREWAAAKDGRLLRDQTTGRMISNGGDA